MRRAADFTEFAALCYLERKMPETEYIIEMKHITKRFPGIVANDDVTLQIKKGEIYALLGENEAGIKEQI